MSQQPTGPTARSWPNARLLAWLRANWFIAGAALSAAVVIAARAWMPFHALWDTAAMIEAAWRWSQGLGLTSTTFTNQPQELAAPVEFITLTWWAPGAPLAMGLLMKAGLDPHATVKLVTCLAIAVGWLGWLRLAQKHLADYLRSSLLAAVLVCFAPLMFTPNRDTDEMLLWAITPWWVLATLAILSPGWIYATVTLVVLAAVFYFFCYHVLHLVAASVLSLLLFPAKLPRRLISVGSQLLALAGGILAINTIFPKPQFLENDTRELSEVFGTFAEMVALFRTLPLLSPVAHLLPGSLSGKIYESTQHPAWGWLSLGLIGLLLAAFIGLYLRSLTTRTPAHSAALLLWIYFLSFPYFLVAASTKAKIAYVIEPYYPRMMVVWLFALLLSVATVRRLRPLLNGLVSVLTIYVLLFSLQVFRPEPNRARGNLLGYSYAGSIWAGDPWIFAKAFPDDFIVPEEILRAGGPIYLVPHQSGPHHFALVNGDTAGRFRWLLGSDHWRSTRTEQDLVVHFLLAEGFVSNSPAQTDTAKHNPNAPLTLHLLEKLPGWRMLEGEVRELGQPMRVYRADLPAGWRGASLFEEQEP